MRHRLSALWVCAPIAALIPYVEVNPRLFPHLEWMAHAGLEGIKEGTLVQHIGVNPLHITVGVVLALAFAMPLGVQRQNSILTQNTTERTDSHI